MLRFGWNSTCYQVLNPGIERWISRDSLALVGYVVSGGYAIVAGAPVCSKEGLPQTVESWEAHCATNQLGVCYFGAESRLQTELGGRPGYTQVALGYQPEWTPSAFVAIMGRTPSLRAQVQRARNHGVTASQWTPERAENHPELQAVLSAWLAKKGLPTLHFLVEPETLHDLSDRRIFVAEHRGRVVGFVTLCPVPSRNGWLTEQFVRLPSAPNGTIELALLDAVQSIAAEGAEYLTMGIVPLVDRGENKPAYEPAWLSLIRNLACAHLHRFYNFRGLDDFKTKFRPQSWQPVVVIVKDSCFRLKHLRAITRAFTKVAPEAAFCIGLMRVLRRR